MKPNIARFAAMCQVAIAVFAVPFPVVAALVALLFGWEIPAFVAIGPWEPVSYQQYSSHMLDGC